MKIFLKIY